MASHECVRPGLGRLGPSDPTGAASDPQGDLAERAADHATDLYAMQEHETRRRRFDRAVELATDRA